MGRDKARLPFRGGWLASYVADTVARAAGSAVLVGDPTAYPEFSYPTIADRYPGAGPLGGILTALHHTSSDWNLVTACDMPGLSAEVLLRILDAATHCDADALVPAGPGGLAEPLCAVYHRRSLDTLEAVFGAGERKIMRALTRVRTEMLPVRDLAVFQNVNTPEDWATHGAE